LEEGSFYYRTSPDAGGKPQEESIENMSVISCDSVNTQMEKNIRIGFE
jgi:hypothetical protein